MPGRIFRRIFPGGITRQGWAVLAGGMFAVVMILGAATGVVWANRDSQIKQWIRWASDFSLMVSEQTRETIVASDLVLRAITDRVQEDNVESEEKFQQLMSTKEVYDMLRQRAAGVPQIDVATVLDSSGTVLNFTRWWPARTQTAPFYKIDLSDRDYFRTQLDDPKIETYIGAPVQNRGTGTWTFYLSRKIRSKSGKILGVALTGLHVEFFSDFYKVVSRGSNRTFSMFRDDGMLMARYPVREDYLGHSFSNGPVMSLGLLNSAEEKTALTDAQRVTDPNHTTLRIISPRRVSGYPLVVNMVVYEEEFLGPWRRNAYYVALFAISLCLVTLGLAFSLASQMSRQDATMAELHESRRAAEFAAQAKSEFLAMMSHEIRTPINAVIGMSDALVECELPDRERGMARIVNEASTHLLTIVNTILDFSRLEAGHDRSTVAPFELRRILRTALELASGLPGANRLDVGCHVSADVPEFVLGDQGRVTQILLNLLGNAVKFTEQGSVHLSVSRVVSFNEPEADRLRFVITDTGPGISNEIADRLFEPFERGESWKSRKGSGTGLGLAISKRLVTMMHGEIGAEGEPGVGSVFWFELPLPATDPGETDAEATSDLPATRAIHILVAEDSLTSQLVARHFLESMGHKVTIAENGAAALAMVKQQSFDLVLMDGHMPEMDGLEATREIRALGGPFAELPIYGLSANVLNSDREMAVRVGMNGYLTKPVRKAEIAAVIAKLFPLQSV